MKSKSDIIGIIPVKAKSDRVKRKNLRNFANTSLFELKLHQLKKTKNFKNFLVSSEDQKILNIAKKKRISNTFKRSLLFYKSSSHERSLLLFGFCSKI